MTNLSIPDKDIEPLQKLASLSDDERLKLLNAIKQIEPTLQLGKLNSKIAEKVDLDKQELLPIIKMFGSMYRGRISSDVSAEMFAADLNKSLQIIEESPFKEMDDNQRNTLTSYISEILALDNSLGITVKALGVMTEHEHVYCRARVLTDMRPIFGENIEKPDAFVTIHTLRIGYHDNKEHKDIFIAMDRNDVKELIDMLKRAEQKEEALDSFLNDSKLVHIDV